MSWSVNLNGPKSVVQREVADAVLLFDRALDWVENSDGDTLSVSLGGYVSWGENNEVTASNVSFSVAESFNASVMQTEDI